MSLYDYRRALELYKHDTSFAALIMAAVMRADTYNAERIRDAFPDLHAEVEARYHAGGGILPGEVGYDEVQATRATLGFPPS